MANESTENKSEAVNEAEVVATEQEAPEVQASEEAQTAEQQADKAEENSEETLSAEQQKINELELALASAKSTVDDQKDSVIRAKAEVDNVRRRAAQDVEKARKFALEKFAGEMLTTVDNLERALQNIDKDDESNKSIIEGIELTYQGLISSLEKFAIKAIDPQDQPFNPELHQAMSMQEVEGVAPNTVIAVMQKGYELNGRLIRPAMVMVSKAKPSVDTSA